MGGESAKQLLKITSVEIAHTVVTQCFAQGLADQALAVVQQVLKKQIAGGPDDYHNLAAELGRRVHYGKACDVLDQGLQHFPQNVDLLASGCKYASEAGQPERATKYRTRLDGIPYEAWNWRAFTFIGDLLEATNQYEEAEKMHRDFIERFPQDERGYSQLVQLFQRQGRLDKAVVESEKGLERVQRPVRLASRGARLMLDQGDYDRSIDYGLRALEYAPREHSSVNESSVHLTLGQAYAARLMAALRVADTAAGRDQPDNLHDDRDHDRDLDEAHRAALHFAAALGSPDTQPRQKDVVRYTLTHLETLLKAAGKGAEAVDHALLPISKVITGEEEQMQKLLRQLAEAGSKD